MAWSFQRCEQEFRRRRGVDRPIARNTRLRRLNDSTFAIRYHETDIVTIHADGRYVLRMNGHGTVSTKRRIEEYAPVQFQSSRRATLSNGTRRSILRVRRVGGSITVDFREGMEVSATRITAGSQGAVVFAPQRSTAARRIVSSYFPYSGPSTVTGRIIRPLGSSVVSRTVLTPNAPVTLAGEGRKVVSVLSKLARVEARIKRTA